MQQAGILSLPCSDVFSGKLAIQIALNLRASDTFNSGRTIHGSKTPRCSRLLLQGRAFQKRGNRGLCVSAVDGHSSVGSHRSFLTGGGGKLRTAYQEELRLLSDGRLGGDLARQIPQEVGNCRSSLAGSAASLTRHKPCAHSEPAWLSSSAQAGSWKTPGRLVSEDALGALVHHFRAHRADSGLWVKVGRDAAICQKLDVAGCRGLLLGRHMHSQDWSVWLPPVGVVQLSALELDGNLPAAATSAPSGNNSWCSPSRAFSLFMQQQQQPLPLSQYQPLQLQQQQQQPLPLSQYQPLQLQQQQQQRQQQRQQVLAGGSCLTLAGNTGRGWTQEQAELVLFAGGGEPADAGEGVTRHDETGGGAPGAQKNRGKGAGGWAHHVLTGVWWDAASVLLPDQPWGWIRATPSTVSSDIAGLTGCLVSSRDDTGDGRGGWRTVNIPSRGLMSVFPSEFQPEEAGMLPPVMRPWWTSVRHTPYTAEHGLVGRRTLVFARSVDARGRVERSTWWAWVKGQGFFHLSSQELTVGCRDQRDLGSSDHVPLGVASSGASSGGGASWMVPAGRA